MTKATQTALTSDDTLDPGQLIVSTRFMESYDLIQPVSGGRDITPFQNDAGDLDVYTVGTNNRVFRFRPEVGGKSGYGESDLGIEAYQLSLYPNGADRDHPNVLGIDADGKLTLSTYNAATSSYEQKVFQPPDATRKLKQMKATQAYGNVYVNVILDNDVVATSFYTPDGTWQSRDWVPIKESEGSEKDGTAARIELCWNNPVQIPLYGIGLDQRVLFSDNRFRFSAWRRLGSLLATAITVVEDEEDRLNIFAADQDGFLWQKREKQYYSGTDVQWDDWVQINGTVPLADVRAVVNAEGLLEVFGIGRDGLLYHTRQVADSKGKPVGWGTLFPLGNPVPSSIFAVGKNGGGYSETFSVTPDDQLYHFWQDPNTTQWYSARVPVPQPTKMETVSVHSVVIQVTDDQALPKAGAKALLKTSNLVSLKINGLSYVVSEFVDRKVQADASGMIRIEYITNTLAAPTLYAATEFMLDGEGVTVEPNAELQDRLYETTTEDVWNAKGADGQYLLKGDDRTQENAEAIAQIMRQSMSLGKPAPGAPNVSMRYLGLNRRTTGLRHHPRGAAGSPFRIDPSQVEEQHWQVDFSGGTVRFHHLERDEVARLLDEKHATLRTTEDAGIFGIEWGDIWNAIKEGVATIFGGIKDFIVTTVVDVATGLVKAIKTVFTLIIDGAEYLWEATIDFFQQAFDIVQGLWEKLKAAFEDLFAWLAFLFDWDDMQRTARAMRHAINTGLEFGAVAIRSLKEPIQQGFGSITKVIETAADEFIATINPEATVGSYSTSQGQADPQTLASSGHSPLLSGFLDNAGDTNAQVNQELADILGSGPLDDLLQQLIDLGDNFQFGDGKEAFDEAVDYITQIGDNPDQILQLGLSAAVRLMESVVLFAVEAAEGVVLSMIDLVADLLLAIEALLNQEWEIPFVSQLWELITGDTLSFRAIDLVTTIIAVPGTVAYKAVAGKAPFPTDASVEEFEKAYTVQWLIEKSGIETPERKKLAASDLARMTAVVEGNKQTWVTLGAVTWVIRGLVEPFQVGIAAYAEDPGTLGKVLGTANVIGRFATAGFTTPWLLDPDAGSFSCASQSNPKEFNNLIWLLQVFLGPGRGSLFVAAAWKGSKTAGQYSDLTLTLWGFAHFGMFVALAVAEGSSKATQAVANSLTTFAPQMLRFAALPYWKDTGYGAVVPAALILLIVFTYPTITLLNLLAAGEEAERVELAPAPVPVLA